MTLIFFDVYVTINNKNLVLKCSDRKTNSKKTMSGTPKRGQARLRIDPLIFERNINYLRKDLWPIQPLEQILFFL